MDRMCERLEGVAQSDRSGALYSYLCNEMEVGRRFSLWPYVRHSVPLRHFYDVASTCPSTVPEV